MHSMNFKGFTANFNGDFSGDVTFDTPEGDARFSIPMEVLEGVVAEKIRRMKIADLENAGVQNILYG